MSPRQRDRITNETAQVGFSLIELLIAMAVFLAVSAIVLSFMFDMTRSQSTVANRTEMHSSVRSVTEVMQQEISQAGRIAIPGTTTLPNQTTLSAAITGSAAAQTVAVGSTSGMFDGMLLSIAACTSSSCPANSGEEIVKVTIPSAGNINGIFTKDHASGAVVRPSGAFPTGILTTTDGNELKMFGDINDDGNMVYVVYTCNPTDTGTGGTLTRSQTAWDGTALGTADTLINNLATNYDASGNVVPCFAFQTKAVSYTALDGVTIVNDAACAAHAATAACTAVVNVAVTLTVRAEQKAQPARADDPSTPKDEQYDYETKALLTVAPRNVFQAWEMSTMSSAAQHMEPTPASITTLVGL